MAYESTKAKIGHGTFISRGDGASPEVFTKIAEVTSVDGPNISRDSVEATNMESPNGFKEFIGGLLDGGEISFEGNFIPRDGTHDGTTGMISEMSDASNVSGNWTITLPGSPAATWNVTGFMTGFEPKQPYDDKMVFSATLKITGKPTLVIS